MAFLEVGKSYKWFVGFEMSCSICRSFFNSQHPAVALKEGQTICAGLKAGKFVYHSAQTKQTGLGTLMLLPVSVSNPVS